MAVPEEGTNNSGRASPYQGPYLVRSADGSPGLEAQLSRVAGSAGNKRVTKLLYRFHRPRRPFARRSLEFANPAFEERQVHERVEAGVTY